MSDFQAGFALAQTLEQMRQQLEAHEKAISYLLEQLKEKEQHGTTTTTEQARR